MVDGRDLAVSGNNKGASDPEARRHCQRRLHCRLVAARDRRAEAEIASKQLRRILKLMRRCCHKRS
jgi:hypothetical protein